VLKPGFAKVCGANRVSIRLVKKLSLEGGASWSCPRCAVGCV